MNEADKAMLAPRCVFCNHECPNGLKDLPFLVVCQNSDCDFYGIFQMGNIQMDKLNKQFPEK